MNKKIWNWSTNTWLNLQTISCGARSVASDAEAGVDSSIDNAGKLLTILTSAFFCKFKKNYCKNILPLQ